MLRPRETQPAQPGPGALGRGLVLATLWSSGPDPAQDALVRVQAARSTDQEQLDLLCAAGEAESANPAFGARVRREFGLDPAELAAGTEPRAAWDELCAFAGDAALLVADLEGFESWRAHLAREEHELGQAIGLCEIAALFLPGRWSARREELVASLLGEEAPAHPRAPAGSRAPAPSCSHASARSRPRCCASRARATAAR